MDFSLLHWIRQGREWFNSGQALTRSWRLLRNWSESNPCWFFFVSKETRTFLWLSWCFPSSITFMPSRDGDFAHTHWTCFRTYIRRIQGSSWFMWVPLPRDPWIHTIKLNKHWFRCFWDHAGADSLEVSISFLQLFDTASFLEEVLFNWSELRFLPDEFFWWVYDNFRMIQCCWERDTFTVFNNIDRKSTESSKTHEPQEWIHMTNFTWC